MAVSVTLSVKILTLLKKCTDPYGNVPRSFSPDLSDLSKVLRFYVWIFVFLFLHKHSSRHNVKVQRTANKPRPLNPVVSLCYSPSAIKK